MDVLDEKQNGAPPMEIDEVVSVRDRKLRISVYMHTLNVVVIVSWQTRLSPPSICRTSGTT